MSEWGRVDADGNVYVKEGDAERLIGQWVTGGDADEAMAFYVRRFENLQTEVELLEKRIEGGTVSAEDAEKAVATIREQLVDAHAVGDLASLSTRLQALEPKLEEARAKRKAEREQRTAESAAAKSRIVDEAEKIAAGRDWRAGADRLRVLLDEWKELPRLARAAGRRPESGRDGGGGGCSCQGFATQGHQGGPALKHTRHHHPFGLSLSKPISGLQVLRQAQDKRAG